MGVEAEADVFLVKCFWGLELEDVGRKLICLRLINFLPTPDTSHLQAFISP